jgi:hypothetical protein
MERLQDGGEGGKEGMRVVHRSMGAPLCRDGRRAERRRGMAAADGSGVGCPGGCWKRMLEAKKSAGLRRSASILQFSASLCCLRAIKLFSSVVSLSKDWAVISSESPAVRLFVAPAQVRPCQMSRTVFAETPNLGPIVLDDRIYPLVDFIMPSFLGRRAKIPCGCFRGKMLAL